jgi:hypothetical protein
VLSLPLLLPFLLLILFLLLLFLLILPPYLLARRGRSVVVVVGGVVGGCGVLEANPSGGRAATVSRSRPRGGHSERK